MNVAGRLPTSRSAGDHAPGDGFVVKEAPGTGGPVVNAMSVDVEEHYQVQAFAGQVDRADWPTHPSRVARNTDLALELFDAAGVKATFFSLGWVAEREPGLIRRIVDAGHELASHGYAHHRADRQSRDVFRADVTRSRQVLEDAGGVPVRGYRAATFSIGEDNLWAFEVLAEAGYAYSSSIYPMRREFCGMAAAPRAPFYPLGPARDGGAAFEEYPLATVELGGRRLPAAGGGHFRIWPYAYSRWAIRRINRRDRLASMFYFHPWELDPDQPRIAGAPLKSRLRHYASLRRMRAKLDRLLADFTWDRVDSVFGGR